MIVDVFHFNNEDEVLGIRLGVLDSVVDRTIVKESDETFTGLKKPYMRSDLYPNVESQRLTFPRGLSVRERDVYQKTLCATGIDDDDIVLFGDVDEVPDTSVVATIVNEYQPGRIYLLSQTLFTGFLNVRVVNSPWFGTRICDGRTYKSLSIHDRVYSTVAHAGWHWSYLGGPEIVRRKLESFAHEELNTLEINQGVEMRLSSGMDPVPRNLRTTPVEIDESFPPYIRENVESFKHLIYRPEIYAYTR